MEYHLHKNHVNKKHRQQSVDYLILENDPEFNADLIPDTSVKPEDKFDLVDDNDIIGNPINIEDDEPKSGEYEGQ